MRVFHALILLAAMLISIAAGPLGGFALAAPKRGEAPRDAKYVWTRVTSRAVLPGGSSFPVFVQGDRAYAFHPDGMWSTADGRSWKPEKLADSKLNTAYLRYVQHEGAIYALGSMKGSYSSFVIDPVIRRTTDFRKWETVGRSNLPNRVFYSAVSFRGAIWLLGGDDGSGARNDVWRSADGLHWEKVMAAAPWSPRTGAQAFVFRNRLWLIGGGSENGQANDAWSTADGKSWVQTTAQISPDQPFGYAVQIYDNKIWLLAVDAEGAAEGRVLISDDGARWRRVEAPWSARSGVAAWVMGQALFLAAGALSGEGDTVYSREVWRMEK